MNNFSPNMLKSFEECQQKFFLKYIEKISLPQRAAFFEKGKKVHALANYYLNGANIEKMEKTLSPEEKNAWENLKSNKYFKLNAINTEYNLTCKVGKYWVGGRLDALMQENISSNSLNKNLINYVILDYKTGQVPANAQQDFQTIVYLLCADKLLNKKGGYNSLNFVYLGLKNNVEKEILFTQDLKKQYEEKVISTCEKIDFCISSKTTSKNMNHCKCCEYNKICEKAV